MNLSKFFIDRPIFAAVLSVLIFLAGLLSIRALPISEYPEVVPPTVVVRALPPAADCSYAQLTKDLAACVTRARTGRAAR